MKKSLSIILSILMLISAFVPFSAYAQSESGSCGENATYEFENGLLTISGSGVISLHPWNYNSERVRKIIINEGITGIDESVFNGLKELNEVIFPDSLKSIGREAFGNCESLEVADLPSNLTVIGISAFRYCTSLKSIELPKTIKSIGAAAFSHCSAVKGKLVIPKDVSINRAAFLNCKSITEVSFEEGFNVDDNVKDRCFKGCENIKTVYIPGSLKNIPQSYFQDCTSLTNVTISEGVERIMGFGGCTSLEKITLPKSAKTICGFLGCEKLKTVKIQGKPDCIQGDCFVNCPSLKSIELPYGVNTVEEHFCGFTSAFNEKKQVIEFSPVKNFKIYGKKCKALTDYCKENGFTFVDMYDVKNATVTMKSQTYNGSAKKPSVTVKLAGTTLKKDTDYTVKYSNNTKVGTAKVTLTGKGKYKGTLTKTYRINPKPTELTKLTAGSKSFKAYWKKRTTQTTGYQIQYSTYKDLKNAKTVTISSNKTGAKTIKNLKAKKNYFVRIRAYKTVNKTKYYSKWSEVLSVKTK